MTRDQFQGPMAALVSQFGGGEYSETRISAIWKVVQGQPIAWLERVVDMFLDGDTAPLAHDFEKRISAATVSGVLSSRGPCAICMGAIWISAPYVAGLSDPLEPAMRCSCVGGPATLADSIRNHKVVSNPDLALRIENTFRGISPMQFKQYGFGKC